MDEQFFSEHRMLSRRFFLKLSGAATAASAGAGLLPGTTLAENLPAALKPALETLESYLTAQDDFRDVSRGKPLPHSLPDARKAEVGLTRESWKLEVVSDPENPAEIRKPLTVENATAIDFEALMALAKDHAVRFPKIMTCNNIGCPLGMGIWEGVPLRDVIWMTGPRRNLRRVLYYGYHNNIPEQMFRSSLPVGRVLEDPFDLPPVILCYKLNGQWLTSERGGPVRIVVPEAYGFKSVKWLSHVVLSNMPHANDTYADGNNDIDSWLKTFAATLSIPNEVKANEAIPVTGYAQVGISGLARVQFWISDDSKENPDDDEHFTNAPWQDAVILSEPEEWGGGLTDRKIFASTNGFDSQTGKPLRWPMRLAKAHWAALLPGLPAGEYSFRCRTIDENGNAQPMPRPFAKSGRTAIEKKKIVVKA